MKKWKKIKEGLKKIEINDNRETGGDKLENLYLLNGNKINKAKA